MQPVIQKDLVESRTDQIARDYEDFAYIVSHDLNAPLRHVKEFTRLLIGSRQNNLTEEEQEYIGLLETSLKKIDDMQQALLTFSRLNTRAGPMRETNCNDIVTNALQELDNAIRQYCVVIECSELPVVIADPNQLQLLFVNLIDNALKFHEGNGKREITITSIQKEENWLFEIKDNGIGIAKEYHEEVLRLFRRLAPDKYKGVGAGLTIAHKIIQRHGGQIVIDSKPGTGTSVFFSIPKS